LPAVACSAGGGGGRKSPNCVFRIRRMKLAT
jgi:hypothetical protein